MIGEMVALGESKGNNEAQFLECGFCQAAGLQKEFINYNIQLMFACRKYLATVLHCQDLFF